MTSGCTRVRGFQEFWHISIIEDEQPLTLTLQPVSDSLHRVSGVGCILLRQVEQLRDLDTACLECDFGIGPGPEDEMILGTIAIGVLNGGLCFADTTQSEDGVSLC